MSNYRKPYYLIISKFKISVFVIPLFIDVKWQIITTKNITRGNNKKNLTFL